MKLTKKVRAQADVTKVMTADEAKDLPGMIGRIAPPMMEAHGFYSYTQNGQKVLVVKA